ncbi:hypothetical protein JTE90_013786 [Oedothorax gibbosus]|uniref:HAT C-terminal dimerisation domain-containing protein n=1 Tax=Oedothorax gibbosus TaxID=931172 RepID=A0AAV6V0B5_9ARAC|nr:hypothetical protein JTE90_013786 [Oedothorax gibbosus]
MSFTKKFQRDEALVHILHSELSLLIQKLAGRVYKSDVLKKIDSIIAQGVNALEVKHFLPLAEIVLSTEVKEELAKVHSNDKSKFLKDVQTHYSSACKYLIEKAHLTKLTKALRCLHPDERQKRRSCEDIITVSKSLPLDVQDDILLDQWKLLQLETENPDSKITRIEHFWNQFFSRCDSLGAPKFDVVSKVIKAALSLYHGNADIERRFSVSRWALTEDKSSMSERTLNAILITKDAVKQYGSPNLVPITKELIASAHCAHRNYQLYLEDVKIKKEAEQKKSEEEEQLKKELLDKQKQTEDAKKDIQAKELDLKKKMKDHESAKETVDTLFKEATERLENAIKNFDMKEVKLAHAMLEGVSKMKEIEEMKCKEVKSLTQSIQKRKSNVISSFMYKKPKLQNK